MRDELGSLLVYVLATWRISSLLVNEGGPGSIFRRLREWAGITHDEQGNKVIIPDTFLGGVFSCVWCSSVWVGAGWVGLDLLWPEGAGLIAAALALSAGAVMVEKWVRG